MPSIANMLIFLVFIVAIALAIFVVYRAFSSNLRPFFIVGMAWKTAVLSPRINIKSFVWIVLVIGIGRALQRFFNAYSIFDETTLLVLSVIWQATLNMSLAMFAVAIHLHTIDQVKTRFGLHDFVLKSSYKSKLLTASVYGGLIWAIGWMTLSAARYFLHSIESNHPTLMANSLTVLLYIESTLLMLVRPAYSLELASPWRNGILASIKAAPSLLAIQACLSIPILVYNLIFVHISGYSTRPWVATAFIGDAIFVLFSAVQFLAIEVAATMLLARMELSRFVFKKSYG